MIDKFVWFEIRNFCAQIWIACIFVALFLKTVYVVLKRIFCIWRFRLYSRQDDNQRMVFILCFGAWRYPGTWLNVGARSQNTCRCCIVFYSCQIFTSFENRLPKRDSEAIEYFSKCYRSSSLSRLSIRYSWCPWWAAEFIRFDPFILPEIIFLKLLNICWRNTWNFLIHCLGICSHFRCTTERGVEWISLFGHCCRFISQEHQTKPIFVVIIMDFCYFFLKSSISLFMWIRHKFDFSWCNFE